MNKENFPLSEALRAHGVDIFNVFKIYVLRKVGKFCSQSGVNKTDKKRRMLNECQESNFHHKENINFHTKNVEENHLRLFRFSRN